MTDKILFVDDEPNVLQAYKRALRKQFDMDMAPGGPEALEMIAANGPYAVIVSDMRMPVMDGVEFLATAKARTPESVRMMLTGNSDQQTAIDAVNKGDIFRFMNKPCPPENLARALDAGLAQYRLITAEKELLQKTLAGSIRVLAEVLSLVNPEAFGRTARLQKTMRKLVVQMGLPKVWWMEPMVLLSQIGCVILPEKVLRKIVNDQPLNQEEYQLYAQHPCIGSDLLDKIPRMEEIAESIRYQEKNFDGSGVPRDEIKGRMIPLGARLLKGVLDFDRHEASGLAPAACLSRMKRQPNLYDPDILAALEQTMVRKAPVETQEVSFSNLKDGMVMARDVKSKSGILILCNGHRITPSVRQHLENFHNNSNLEEPLHVLLTDNEAPVSRQTS